MKKWVQVEQRGDGYMHMVICHPGIPLGRNVLQILGALPANIFQLAYTLGIVSDVESHIAWIPAFPRLVHTDWLCGMKVQPFQHNLYSILQSTLGHMLVCAFSVTSVMSDSLWLWTVVHQVPQSMGFSRQENWNGLPCPSPWDCTNPGIKPSSPTLQVDSLPVSYQGRQRSLVSMGSQRFGYDWVTSLSLSPGKTSSMKHQPGLHYRFLLKFGFSCQLLLFTIFFPTTADLKSTTY